MTPEKGAKLAANLLILAFKDITLGDGSISVALEPHSVRLGPSEQRYLFRLAALTAIKKAARKLVPLLAFYPLDKCIDRISTIVVETKDAGTPLAEPISAISM